MIIRDEMPINVLGYEAKASNVILNKETGLIVSQKVKVRKELRHGRVIVAQIRLDDECGNKHETFSITGTIYDPSIRGSDKVESCGCIHDEIAKYFPNLIPLIKWHLTSVDGPCYYIENTTYHASNRDYNGLLKGETKQIISGKTGLPCWTLEVIGEKPPQYVDSLTQPELPKGTEYRYVPWNKIGEGKERDFNAARSCAIWPEATDEQLSLPKEELTAILMARHPKLMEDFKNDMIGANLIWPRRLMKESDLPK